MKMPIPQDYDISQGLTCFEIYWPNSPYWLYILQGFLTTPMRGRFWDERSGVIKAAQAIGKLIMLENEHLRRCRSCGPQNDGNGADWPVFDGMCPDCDGAGIDDCEDCNMSNGPCPPIRIFEGKLQYWWCCEWVDIPGVIVGADDLPDDNGIFPPDPTGASYACRKARGIADQMIAIMADVFDAAENLPPRPDIVVTRWPTVSFNLAYLILAMDEIGPFDNQTFEDNQTVYADTLACAWQSLLTDDSNRLGDTQFGAIKDAALVVLPQYLGQGMVYLLDAVGIGDVSDFAVANLYDENADCTCPDQQQDPTYSWSTDWARYVDFRQTDPVTVGITLLSNAVYTAGVGIQSDPDDGNGYHTPGIEWSILSGDADNTVTHAWFEYECVAEFDYADGPKCYTDDETLIPSSQKPDGDPSVGGVWVSQRTSLDVPTNNRLYVRWEAKGYNPAGKRLLSDSWTLRRIAIGGMGSDPFTA